MTAAQGRFLVRLGEVTRRESFRDEGATSAKAWAVERFGLATATARAYVEVAEKAPEVPQLVGALCEAEIVLGQGAGRASMWPPLRPSASCVEQAKGHSVRELVDIARMSAEARDAAGRSAPARSEHDRRYLRFNDAFRTLTVQLPAESYAETKACLEARAVRCLLRPRSTLRARSLEGEAPSAGTVRGHGHFGQGHFSGHGHFSRQDPLGPAPL